jgi:carboxylesterase
VETTVPVLEGAEPFTERGDGLGFLLCHGFTGSPQSLRGWAEHLAAAGHSVSLPRLPGHGTTWTEMNRTTWHDWYATVDAAFAELREACDTVVVCGLSMGAALALRLAQEHGPDVAGLVLVNPAVRIQDPKLIALPVLRRFVGSVAGIASDIKKPGSVELAYDRTPLNALASLLELFAAVRSGLPRVTQPLLVLRSAEDHVVPASNSRIVLEGVSSTDSSEHVLSDSFHVATLDNDAPTIFEETVRFAERVSGGVS